MALLLNYSFCDTGLFVYPGVVLNCLNCCSFKTGPQVWQTCVYCLKFLDLEVSCLSNIEAIFTYSVKHGRRMEY